MKRYNDWIESNLGMILMLSAIPAAILIVISYFDIVISHSVVTLTLFLAIVILNSIAIIIRRKTNSLIAIRVVWLIYLMAMGVLLFLKTTFVDTNRLNALIFYLFGIAFYFLLGFEHKNRKEKDL